MEDMTSFRWILLLLGLLILVLIFIVGNRRSVSRRQSVQPEDLHDTPSMNTHDVVDADVDLQQIGASIRIAGDGVSSDNNEVTVSTEDATIDVGDVISLYLMAKDGEAFSGNQILHAVTQLGFEYGDMRIFHYRHSMTDKQPWFSIANVFEPGWFDMEGLTVFQTRGIVMFMQVPNEHGTVRVFDAMVEKAEQLSHVLRAQLLDGNRSSLTRQTINHIREQLVAARYGVRS